ncbi:MAG: 4-hydroxy-tetrahydrodipicolinate reductase [Prolixibacteraceae bacterium]|nr:4-hydroxy-tetrahydrodipicolinate reductase [Prolixibacteraceae bacterium]
MNLALIGYGKMGKEIEKIAIERGHQISLILDIDNPEDFTVENLKNCDVAVEFTRPETAVDNYYKCLEAGIPVVSGTTGWLDRKEEVFDKFRKANGTLFYASNFSIGVNLFFELNRKLAELMAPYSDYNVGIKEVHHTQKLDSPSGTAISIAEDIINKIPAKESWINEPQKTADQLEIISERTGDVPGIHSVKYESDIDFIEITHSIKKRKGLAFGSVLAAEFCLSHSGILSMKDLLKI